MKKQLDDSSYDDLNKVFAKTIKNTGEDLNFFDVFEHIFKD